jgi:hypothetical protein
VLHPALRELSDSNVLDFTQLTLRLRSAPVLEGGPKALARAVGSGTFFSLPAGGGVTLGYLYLLAMCFAAQIDGSQVSIINSIYVGGMALAMAQLGATLGEARAAANEGFTFATRDLSNAQVTQFTDLYVSTTNAIVENFPKTPATLQECEEACEKIAIEHNKNTLLKGELIRAVYFLGMRPLVRTLFVAAFCTGNAQIRNVRRPDTTVYDSRTADMLLMTAATQIIFVLVNELDKIGASVPRPREVPHNINQKLLDAFMQTVVAFYSTQEAAVGDRAIASMYDKIAQIAARNDELHRGVLQASSTLMVRKEDAMTMFRNMELSKQRTASARTTYSIWFATLIVFFVSAAVMAFFASPRDILIHAGIVAVVALIAMVLLK